MIDYKCSKEGNLHKALQATKQLTRKEYTPCPRQLQSTTTRTWLPPCRKHIELVKIGKAKGERLGPLTHVVGSSISHLGEEIAREKYALALLEVDANMNYDLETEDGINELNLYVTEKLDACEKYTAHWEKVYARWKSKFGIEN